MEDFVAALFASPGIAVGFAIAAREPAVIWGKFGRLSGKSYAASANG